MLKSLKLAAVTCGLTLAFAAAPAFAQVPKTGPTPVPAVSIPPALPPLIKHEIYVSGGYLIPAIVCNQFTSTNCTVGSRYGAHVYRGAAEFPLGGSLTGMLKVDYRLFRYTAPGGVVNLLGGGTTFAAPFAAKEDELDARVGVRVLEPRLYLGASVLRRTNDYGYPRLNGVGLGLEKLPDTDQTFSLYGGAYYYPNVHGSFIDSTGASTDLRYHELRYDMGVTLKSSNHSPVFVDLGYLGDHTRDGGNAPARESRSGPFIGIGITL